MDPDLMFVLGALIGAGTIPAAISSFSTGQPLRWAFICILVGGGLLSGAMIQNPSGYSFEDVPRVFKDVAVDIFTT